MDYSWWTSSGLRSLGLESSGMKKPLMFQQLSRSQFAFHDSSLELPGRELFYAFRFPVSGLPSLWPMAAFSP